MSDIWKFIKHHPFISFFIWVFFVSLCKSINRATMSDAQKEEIAFNDSIRKLEKEAEKEAFKEKLRHPEQLEKEEQEAKQRLENSLIDLYYSTKN